MDLARATVRLPLLALFATMTGGCDNPPAAARERRAPPAPAADAAAPEGMASTAFAIRTLFLGDTDRQGLSSDNAWKDYGFDIDGVATTATSGGVCQLVPGASKVVQIDGTGGIDNSFGTNVLPILRILLDGKAQTFPQKMQSSFTAGTTTDLVVTTGIGAGPDYRDLRGAFVIGAPLGASPAWNGSDVWPLSGVSLSGADVSTASLAFTGGYMVERTLVARPGGMGLLTIGATEGARIELPITHLTVTMNVSNDGMSATNGIVSGVIPTERLVDAARVLVAALPPNGFCRQAFESVASTLRQASDILVDGSIAPNKPCDGVSIGLGFEATRVALGPVVAAPAPIDNCADADGGADAAGD